MEAQFEFTIGDRKFEAVKPVPQGGYPIMGSEMLKRASGKNGGAITDEDEAFLAKHLAEFPALIPAKFQKYYLTTNRLNPDGTRSVSFFSQKTYDTNKWYQGWAWLDSKWSHAYLVLRRCL